MEVEDNYERFSVLHTPYILEKKNKAEQLTSYRIHSVAVMVRAPFHHCDDKVNGYDDKVNG